MNRPAVTPLKVDIWSDVTCVWCHIGSRAFEIGRDSYVAAGGAVEVEYHAYQLDKNPPVEYGGRYAEYLTEVMNLPAAQVRERFEMIDRVGADVGLAFDWGGLQPARTLLAHQAIRHAEAHGLQAQMNRRLMAAYFEEGRDVGNIDELADLAAEVGLDPDGLRAALAAEEHLPAVRDDIARAGELGITGVPFFVVDGRYGLSGAQSPEAFVEALERASREVR